MLLNAIAICKLHIFLMDRLSKIAAFERILNIFFKCFDMTQSTLLFLHTFFTILNSHAFHFEMQLSRNNENFCFLPNLFRYSSYSVREKNNVHFRFLYSFRTLFQIIAETLHFCKSSISLNPEIFAACFLAKKS